MTARRDRYDGTTGERRRVDVWHASPEGYYESEDPTQADINLRGKFTTDASGTIRFRSVKPAGYRFP